MEMAPSLEHPIRISHPILWVLQRGIGRRYHHPKHDTCASFSSDDVHVVRDDRENCQEKSGVFFTIFFGA